MIILLALLFLFRQYETNAAPVTAPFPESSTYNVTLFIRDNPTGARPGRSAWDILWSCMATTFAVTWVSVHPNVPFLEESRLHLLKRRMLLMCLALLVPEAMIIWAIKQWRGAVMIKETINKACPESSSLKWTMTHAHFLQMGGFKVTYLENEDFYCSKKYRYSATKKKIAAQEGFLSFTAFRELLNKQLISFPETTAKEIEDRSKSDALSKGVVLLQITWFLVQLIARAHQNLAITEIELTTAALAGLNSIMYLFWWNKPFDVRCPIVIRTRELERRLVEAEMEEKRVNNNNDEQSGGSIDAQEKEGNVETDQAKSEQTTSLLTDPDVQMSSLAGNSMTVELTKWSFPVNEYGYPIRVDFDLPSHLAAQILNIIRRIRDRVSLASNNNGEKPRRSGRLKWIWANCKSAVTKLVYFPYLLMFMPVNAILNPYQATIILPFSEAKDKMNNAPSLQLLFNEDDMRWIMSMMFSSEDAESKSLLIFSALAGATFGLIHCAAWNFDFPSPIEQVLWRTASLTIVGICICIIAGIPLYIFVRKKYWDALSHSKSEIWWWTVRMTVETAPAIVNPLARVTLLILSLLSLCDLSPSALETVTWTKFIPHI